LSETDWRETLLLRLFLLAQILHLDRLVRFGTAYPFLDFFKGFEKNDAVRQIFGNRTDEVLHRLKVRFTWVGGYMWVDGRDGYLTINSRYLNGGDRVDIYLDVIHELVHVRQFTDGRQLFDNRFRYSERPTEVEAYRHAVKEARRLGLRDERICEYLKTEWMSERDLRQLATALGVRC